MELNEYRAVQRRLALLRDDYCCAICWVKRGERVEATDVHHVYGRASKVTAKESYRNLLSLCRSCHQSIDAIRSQNSNYLWVAEVLEHVNDSPTNQIFRHQELPI